jgi:anaerobic dimethyl sulfoxide reductase subunit C (anchor subunit)
MMGEWALVLFTVLSQMAAGAFITLWVLDTVKGNMKEATGTFVSQGVVLAMGLGLLVSLGHLGHPLEAYRASAHFGTSWLSREVVLFGLFFFLTVVYYWQWRTGGARRLVGIIGSVVALLAVPTSGMVYVLAAIPAWNSFGPIFFFLLTASTLGPLYTAVLLTLKQYSLGKGLFQFVMAALVCSCMSFALYLSLLISVGDVAALTGWNTMLSITFWLRLFIGWIAPLGILGYVLAQQQWHISRYVILAFALVLIGELLGRELFYGSAVALTMFGL